MREKEFKCWLNLKNCNEKVISDHLSRLRRLEREVSHSKKCVIDIDNEYARDRCKYLFSIFFNSGKNYVMEELLPINLPIGSYSINAIKYSLRKYVEFIESEQAYH